MRRRIRVRAVLPLTNRQQRIHARGQRHGGQWDGPGLLGTVAAHGIIEEFKRARDEIKKDQMTIPIWQPLLAKYTPTLIGECEKAIKWAEERTKEWFTTSMFAGEPDALSEGAAETIRAVAGGDAGRSGGAASVASRPRRQ